MRESRKMGTNSDGSIRRYTASSRKLVLGGMEREEVIFTWVKLL